MENKVSDHFKQNVIKYLKAGIQFCFLLFKYRVISGSLRAAVGANQPSLQVRGETKWINRGKTGRPLKGGLFLQSYMLFLLHLNQTRGSDFMVLQRESWKQTHWHDTDW